LTPIGSTGAEARGRLRSIAERWSEVVKAADIKVE
jgi:hypothetical protein